MECTPEALLELAKCFLPLTERQLDAAMVILLCDINNP